MSKKERSALWDDLSAHWEFEGPDPRWRAQPITVHWSTTLQPIEEDGRIYKNEQSYEAKSLADAQKKYRACVSDPKTKHCDVRMHLLFGGFYTPPAARDEKGEPIFVPRMSETYIYLVRWRADGAFLETYHINESKFGEREPERNELTKTAKAPGLMAHYQQKKKQKTADE